MSKKLKIIMPSGAMGADKFDGAIDTAMRMIAIAASSDPEGDWAEKYGANFENNVFMMHRFCWCEEESCGWCEGDLPNFWHKASDLKITWYKYIGRGVEKNKKISYLDFSKIVQECLYSIQKVE